MSQTWQLQEAKNRFSELVNEAIERGPQVITRRGIETAVLLSVADYRKMALGARSITEFFRNSPLVGEDLDMSRDQSPIRAETAL
ncbi:MAG TPA: type II toxin-antitoxin system Phd/YefM family antitoxin [Armatimonadota bacterium]|nr:type II toxin-antitoxin system Phd/YefM family antitoxin [Armatimonadota bacterium]